MAASKTNRPALPQLRLEVRQEVERRAMECKSALARMLRRPLAWIQRLFVLSFLTSLTFHVAIIVLGLLTYEVRKQMVERVQEQVFVPDATIIQGAEVGAVPTAGLG